MARVKRSIIVMRQVEMLSYLQQQSEDSGRVSVALSLTTIARAQGLSSNQVRLILRSLEGSSLLKVERSTLPNGGTAENSYRVTAQGRALLNEYTVCAQDDKKVTSHERC